MKLIFEQGAEGHCLHLLPACDVPEYQLSAERTAPLHLPHVSERADPALYGPVQADPRRERRVLPARLLHDEV